MCYTASEIKGEEDSGGVAMLPCINILRWPFATSFYCKNVVQFNHEGMVHCTYDHVWKGSAIVIAK